MTKTKSIQHKEKISGISLLYPRSQMSILPNDKIEIAFLFHANRPIVYHHKLRVISYPQISTTSISVVCSCMLSDEDIVFRKKFETQAQADQLSFIDHYCFV